MELTDWIIIFCLDATSPFIMGLIVLNYLLMRRNAQGGGGLFSSPPPLGAACYAYHNIAKTLSFALLNHVDIG